MDYDANNNDLIDIASLAQLNAIRWDSDGDGAPDSSAVRPGYDTAFPGRTTTTTGRMGCPNTCAGYELTLSLTFPASTSSAYNPWTPVAAYAAEFNGNGHTLTDLNVSVASGHAGLFHSLNSGALVRNVGLIEPYVTAGGVANEIGGLAGRALAGSSIETSYVRDGEIAVGNGGQAAGGLVGYLEGAIRASYANGVALRTTDPCTNCNNINLGGLAGYMEGAAITGSYAAATSGPVLFNQQRVGGLVGRAISIVARAHHHHQQLLRHRAAAGHQRRELRGESKRPHPGLRQPNHRPTANPHRLRRPLRPLEPGSGLQRPPRLPVEFRQRQPIPHAARPNGPSPAAVANGLRCQQQRPH